MLVLASHNPNKTKIISAALKRAKISCVSASTLGLTEPDENGETLIENAATKALCAAHQTNMISLANDSSLFVPVLDGGPGVYTANWSYTPKGRDWDMAMAKIHDAVIERGTVFPRWCIFRRHLGSGTPRRRH